MKVLIIEDDKWIPGVIALRWHIKLKRGGWWMSPIWGNARNDTLESVLRDVRRVNGAPFGIEDRRVSK